MYALRHREELPPSVVTELDDFIAWLKQYLSTSLNEDGTLKLATPSGAGNAVSATSIMETIEDAEGHWWKKGPWIFDTTHSHEAFLYPPATPAGTYNDYAPGGIDTAIGIEFNPTGNFTLTGLKAPPGNYRRLLVLRNQSASFTVTLKHAGAGSQEINRFALPGDLDIVMGTRQTAWLYYDADNRRWGSFITGNTAGGLSGAGGGSSSGDVVGPGSAIDGDIAVFDGATGKLIKDGGQTITTVIAAAASSSNLKTATIDIGAATVATMDVTPVSVVAAQGAHTIIVPLMLIGEKHFTVAGSSGFGISLRFTGDSHTLVTLGNLGLNNTTETLDYNSLTSLSSATSGITVTTMINKGMSVVTSGPVGGTPSGTVRLTLYYVVVTSLI